MELKEIDSFSSFSSFEYPGHHKIRRSLLDCRLLAMIPILLALW